MSISIEINDYTGDVLQRIEEAIDNGLEEVGVKAEGYAAAALESHPRRIDTGLLRNSITHARGGQPMAKASYTSDDGSKTGSYSGSMDGDKKAVYIGTNVAYAGYVHDGTSKMEPNRFLASAASGHGDDYSKIMERSLKDV